MERFRFDGDVGSGMTFVHSRGKANLPIILTGAAHRGGNMAAKSMKAAASKAGYTYDLENPGNHYAFRHKPVNAISQSTPGRTCVNGC